jgi:hypothetical protein
MEGVSILKIKAILVVLTHLKIVEESKKYFTTTRKSLPIISQLFLKNKEV